MATRPPLRTISLLSTPTSSTDSPTSSSTPTTTIQSITSFLNNPTASAPTSTSFFPWPSLPSDIPAPPTAPSTPLPDVSLADFSPYLSSISESFARFADILHHNQSPSTKSSSEHATSGSGLAACLREVPSLFFKEDFELEDGPTFRAACPFSPDPDENAELQERLGAHLDVVEAHLVREIALRSESFYEAQGKLRGLDGEIVEAVGRIRELRENVRVLTGDVVGTAAEVQELNTTRENLVALHQKLTLILYVGQAVQALKLLVAAADCAGALDVIDDLQHLLDTNELTGLHCLRNLRDQLAGSLDSVISILSAEFVRAAIPDVKAIDAIILSNVKKQSSSLQNGIDHQINIDEDESTILRERLLPLIICLLRTGQLPDVLKTYRETLMTVMKASIKATVAELLPVLIVRPLDSDLATADRAVDSDVGGQSLASKLRSLSSESFVQLLAAIFKIVQVHLVQAAEVKKVIEWIMSNLDGNYSADAAGTVSDFLHDSENGVVSHNSYNLNWSSPKLPFIQGKTSDIASPNSTKNFRSDILRENTEAVFAACDAAHGRWAKLLGVRTLLHPKLRLQEFLSIYNISQDFIAATEKIGGRSGYNSIRGALQTQSRSFVEYQHEARMTKMRAVLDQETWVAVDVPDEFQAIVLSLSSNDSIVDSIELVAAAESSKAVESDVSSSQHLSSADSAEDVVENDNRTAGTSQESKAEATTSIQANDNSTVEHVKAPPHTILHGGVGYHMVNCGLILLKMLSEYVDIGKCLPLLSPEVVHRVADILKLFNTRTCQLVLGAGAMQVSGLKSITSKHLALASQVVSFIYAIIPDIRRVLFLKIPEARKQVLMSEFDRVAQDYKLHRDEIHSKLVQIMRERLLANLRKLPQIVEGWNAPEDGDLQPSQFAKAVTKEVTYLNRILSQTLLEVDVQAIFRQVVQFFHSHITEAFSKLEVNTPQAKNRLCRDVQHILACIRKLPSENFSTETVPNYGLLDEFLAENFGTKVGE